MTKSLNKIKVHPLTYLIGLLLYTEGYFKYFVIVFGIIIVHELGHLLMAKLFKRKILRIEILPFGGLLKMDAPINTNTIEDFLIATGGIISQVIIINIVVYMPLFSSKTDNLIKFYNDSIILFNLLPIIPLDGHKMLKCLLELLVPFKKSIIYSFIISLISIFLVTILRENIVYLNIFTLLFLVYSSHIEINNLKYIMNRFYLERLKNKFRFRRTARISRITDMYKCRNNILNGLDEHTFLKEHFTRY